MLRLKVQHPHGNNQRWIGLAFIDNEIISQWIAPWFLSCHAREADLKSERKAETWSEY